MNSLQSNSRYRRHLRAPRAGLSVLEFIGCTMALVGGVWLGAIYLGVDMRHIAYVALSESSLLEKVPEDWRPVDPENPETPTPAELALKVQEELVALRHEIKALRSTRSPADDTKAESASPSGDSATEASTSKEASLAYWKRIQDVVLGQTNLQVDAESAATNANATKVAALKGRISHFAASAIRAIPAAGVDRSAIELGNELADWYEQGGELYDEAVRIWESPVRSQNNPALTKGWEHARVQHRNEGQLLDEKIAAVRDTLTRRFGDGFSAFSAL